MKPSNLLYESTWNIYIYLLFIVLQFNFLWRRIFQTVCGEMKKDIIASNNDGREKCGEYYIQHLHLSL